MEKLALHYLAAAPHLANARQLREFAVRAVERGSARCDRIRYDDSDATDALARAEMGAPSARRVLGIGPVTRSSKGHPTST